MGGFPFRFFRIGRRRLICAFRHSKPQPAQLLEVKSLIKKFRGRYGYFYSLLKQIAKSRYLIENKEKVHVYNATELPIASAIIVA